MKGTPVLSGGSLTSKPAWSNASGCSTMPVFFWRWQPMAKFTKDEPMGKSNLTMAQQVAEAASAFQQMRTGRVPDSVSVNLSEKTLVITLHGTLSPAERAVTQTPARAALVQDYHRQLFAGSADSMRREIKRITGVDVREATAEVETKTGTVVNVFTTGTTVQVFLLAHGIPGDTWSFGRTAEHA
jgi:uncharacterized protein YbcI